MKKETINKLNRLQNFLAIMFASIVIYMGFIWFGLPTLNYLFNIMMLIPKLEMPYLFFGYVFMFWFTLTLFSTTIKAGIWGLENLGHKEDSKERGDKDE